MQNNIPTVYISELNCCIVKSTKLSTIFEILYKKYKNSLKFKNNRVAMVTLELTRNASRRSVYFQYFVLLSIAVASYNKATSYPGSYLRDPGYEVDNKANNNNGFCHFYMKSIKLIHAAPRNGHAAATRAIVATQRLGTRQKYYAKLC